LPDNQLEIYTGSDDIFCALLEALEVEETSIHNSDDVEGIPTNEQISKFRKELDGVSLGKDLFVGPCFCTILEINGKSAGTLAF